MTIHDNIDEFLSADLHSELSDEERNALHSHLVECAHCRQAHQETKAMNKVLEEKFENEKPDIAFEQRMLAHFRNGVSKRRGAISNFFLDVTRMRTVRVAAAAAVLVMMGAWLTGVRFGFLGQPDERSMAEMMQGNSLDDLRGRLSWPEQKAEMLEEARKRVALQPEFAESEEASVAKAAPAASPTIGRETNAKSDITRLGVRSPTDIVKRLPASTTAGIPENAAKSAVAEAAPAQEKDESSLNKNGEMMAEVTAPELAASPTASAILANRKLIRNATVELEIVSFDTAVQKITAFANEEKGYVAATSSEKQENGKLKGEIVVKVLPENLDRFLQKIRGLGELKNQTLGTEDITKAYFDTDARLKNARVMEQRLIDMLKKKSDDINDLLQVEKELGRVREEIEKMQGDLKYWDSQVQFATITISLAEKDMEEAAAFLLKERAQLALYSPEVEKVYNDIKRLASPKAQITNAQLDRDNSGRVSARVSMLIVPEESDGVIGKVKAMGRVENFQVQTERVAQGGEGISENAKTKRDKVELNISLSRDEQEQSLQQTTLRIRTSSVDDKSKALRSLAEKQNGRVRSSSFSRDPNGREFANVTLRVPMKNYTALMQSLDSLGKVENVSVQRQDRAGAQIDEANAPADLSIQVYSQGNIVSSDSGLIPTLRRTIAQSAGAIMWSLRMIGVAIAFLAPWVVALVAVVWVARRVMRGRRKL
jgi:Domain of unknown function (DUF4349)